MTTISEIGMPAFDPADRPSLIKPRRVSLVALIVSAAIAVSILNLSATAYLYRIMGDLRDVDESLNQLAEFEQRLASRLDAMNTGVQNRLENMNGELQGQFNQLHDSIAGLKSSAPDTLAVDLPVEAKTMSDVGKWVSPIEEPTIAPAAIEEEQADAEPVAKKKPPRTTPSAHSAYERTQSADGKVYYRKVR